MSGKEGTPTVHPEDEVWSNRVCTDVIPPTRHLPTDAELYLNSNTKNPDYDFMKEHFLREGKLSMDHVFALTRAVREIFKSEENVLSLDDPITVCGDVHGQFFDLVKLFEVGGSPASTKYLFLGDYVDRGYFSCEVVFMLFAIKIRHPDSFYMLRGNHECRHLTAYFNFKSECIHKYSEEVYDEIMNTFDHLPLAAIVNGRFFCVHGGLSPEAESVKAIQDIQRAREPPQSGAMCDILWSDPMREEEEEYLGDSFYSPNDMRGCSCVYSYKAVVKFLKNNHLLCVIRAHEAQDEGYHLYKKVPSTDFPSVICIFSAPNYCDMYNNKGAVIRFHNNLMNIRQFNYSPHPYCLPNFANAFSWSLPFVAEKVTEMFQTILDLVEDAEDEDSSDEEGGGASSSAGSLSALKAFNGPPGSDLATRGEVIKRKIRAVGRLCRMYTTLREENESVVLLKGLAGGQIPQGLLAEGPAGIRRALVDFQRVKELDQVNERMPPPPGEEGEGPVLPGSLGRAGSSSRLR